MAGIGFELRRVLREQTLTSIFKAFGYSLALSSGPYIISITSLLLLNLLSFSFDITKQVLIQFQVSVTYLIAFSLIYTGFSQLFFTRYIADRIFEREYFRLLPNFYGIIILNMLPAFILSLLFGVLFLSKDAGYFFSLLFSLTFTIMTGLWMVNIILTSLKSYKFILFSFFSGYALFIILSFLFSKYGLNGLIFSFFTGQSVLFLMLLSYFTYLHYADRLVEFDFVNKNKIYVSLIFTGFFYNIAIWTDKFIFWFNDHTGTQVLGPFRYSVVYDIPIFLAYLAIAPGMAIFFLKLEGEFANYYERYYDAVIRGLTLEKIYTYGDELISSARAVVLDTVRVQGIFNIIIILFDEFLFNVFKIPTIYLPLFHVLLAGTYLQLVLMSIFALLFYFDRRQEVFLLSLLFFLLNFSLTYTTLILGPYFYGYGFAVSVFVCVIFGILLLRRFLHEVHYYTFMLR